MYSQTTKPDSTVCIYVFGALLIHICNNNWGRRGYQLENGRTLDELEVGDLEGTCERKRKKEVMELILVKNLLNNK